MVVRAVVYSRYPTSYHISPIYVRCNSSRIFQPTLVVYLGIDVALVSRPTSSDLAPALVPPRHRCTAARSLAPSKPTLKSTPRRATSLSACTGQTRTSTSLSKRRRRVVCRSSTSAQPTSSKAAPLASSGSPGSSSGCTFSRRSTSR